MSVEKIERKIAVIFATDVVGYSKHMETDEVETVQNIRACEKILTSLFDNYDARLFNTGGDSFLAEFPSAVSAVECAVAFQEAIYARNGLKETTVKLEFRIGINSGDVIKEKDNLLGDGVNIAARLEALAQTNGITVSKGIYDFVKGKTNFEFNDIGIQKVKQNEFHAYDLLLDPRQKRKLTSARKAGFMQAKVLAVLVSLTLVLVVGFFFVIRNDFFTPEKPVEKITLSSIDRPAVLVLPFESQTTNESVEYLAYGMTSNIRSTLSNIETIYVAPSSTGKFVSKNQYSDEQILDQYGFQFVLRGSIQGFNDTYRVLVEMSDLLKGELSWSEIYEFKGEGDIFRIQDSISIEVLEQMRIEFSRGGIREGMPQISKDVTNYKKIMKAESLFSKNSPSANLESERLFQEVLKDEPNNHYVMINLGWVYWQKIIMGISKDVPKDIDTAYSYANEVLLHNPDRMGALSLTAVMELISGKSEKACDRIADMKRLSITPMDLALTASLQQSCGDLTEAIANYEYVMEVAPHFSSWVKNRYSFALVAGTKFDKAIAFFESQLQEGHLWSGAKQNFFLLSAYIYSKRNDQKKAMEMFELHKTADQKMATESKIRQELSMDPKGFVDDYVKTLKELGL